jgi:chromosomal replication initiation ATPase DnaA
LARQLRLKLKRPASHAREDFVLSPTNADAVRALDAWPDWPGCCLVIVGPEGSGKSHLAREWAQRTGAVPFTGEEALGPLEGCPVLIEDADRGVADEALFHLINMAGQPGGGLLLTARTPPAEWPAALPDLRSRLNGLTVTTLAEPDDALLRGVLEKFFRERNIKPADDIYPYLIRRIERSVPAALAVVRRLDEAADEEQRPVSRALARQLLETDDQTLELFD